jgi:rod shape-determining protein MreC
MVVTSDLSLFPAGYHLGKVSQPKTKGGGFFLNMEVALAVDFSKLEYVYVVKTSLPRASGIGGQEKKDE